ncbi:MAG: hypothetical protein WKI04_01400 [Ferruginibacter sp.]
MIKVLMLVTLFSGNCWFKIYAQKKYGYTILHFRCGNSDPQKDRIYYSPLVELNTLNFPEYTMGMDPSIIPHSARYYNYAISKWFEIYLKDKYKIRINSPDKYARKSITAVYNNTKQADCNDDKTSPGCFFLNREELSVQRKDAINKSRAPDNKTAVCEVIDL